jgi:predicted lipoprotein with Yx(FWY)xxD motif
MSSKSALLSIVAAAGIMASACGSTGTSANAPQPSPVVSPAASPVAASPVASSPSPSTAPVGVVIGVAHTRLGTILVDASGRTLYLFVADRGTKSVCYGSCAQVWPPVLSNGAPQAGPGVNAALLGTTARTDGKVEVTYAGHPLYYFISDKKPGDVTGQAVNGFGGPWYVVAPSGMQVL